ncbi:serine protease filzig [Helicoverpa armigera]|uniref:serine protease filzig n=1 Tax=Helicoverpa armigera TaxID=29058 RepID=UPI00308293D7
MTVRKWFDFGKSLRRSDVKMLFSILVILTVLDNLPLTCKGEDYDRESRKLFGGYRITPTYCKASRAAKYNRGNTICMFNHECYQRGGEVVGACMDGFLFGACCQLKSDSQSHIPKGPGIVMTSYLDYPEATEGDDYDAEELSAWHNSYKPVVTPGYKPADKTAATTVIPEDLSTEGEHAEMISEGLTQITNTLLSSPPQDSSGIIYVKPKPDYYTHSSIDHGGPETILVHTNGSVVDNVVRPSDFNIQLSSMQTKPTVTPSTSTTEAQKTVSTHRPIKPIFRPKPVTSTESYVLISTAKDTQKPPELSSINSIIQMLNDSTPSMKEDSVTPSIDVMETKSSPAPAYSYTYPSYSSTGHYVTLKPTSLSTYLTKKPAPSKKPSYDYVHTTPNSLPQDDKPSSYFSSPSPSQSTSQAIDAFNRYPTDPTDFGDLSTFSYVSSTTTQRPTTAKKPPSTSYVTGATPVRRPALPPSPPYDNVDTFSSVTPTVIVLNDIHTTKTPLDADEPQFVEISQEPFKKPVSQITVNNHIAATNNIYMGKPSYPTSSSPTVVITPKPGLVTTPYPIKSSIGTRPAPILTSPIMEYTEAPTTNKPEMQTSPDDLINFPPVRNPMLNATGSNPALYNTSISLSDNELDMLDAEITTPTWEMDDKLNEKMNVFVNKIVGNLQGTFQELHDIVILNKKPNETAVRITTTTVKPKRTTPTTKRPFLTTTKKPPLRTTTSKPTTKRPPVKTTKKPIRSTTPYRRPPTTTQPPTTTIPVRRPVTTTKKPKPTKKVTTTTQAATTSTELADEITTETYVNDKPIDYNDKNLCGIRPLAKSGRIVGGKSSTFGEWPWQVLVRESTWLGLFTKNKCGGVLITNKFVTTAAHCQPGFLASLVAVFGENDISGDFEPKKPVSRNVRKVIVHRSYDAATFENDLALLELEAPIKFDAHIVPICMPPDEADFTGRVATVTGWGRLKYGGSVPALLQEVQVPVIENSACQDMFQTAGHSKKILKSFICAGYANGQKDSCEGDSGGPLVLQREDGKWQLVGTVSHGIKCAAPFLPGVYMRTTFYKPWLKSITGVH